MKKILMSLGTIGAVVAPVAVVVSCNSKNSAADDNKPTDARLDFPEGSLTDEVTFAALKQHISDQLSAIRNAVNPGGVSDSYYFTLFQPKDDAYKETKYHQAFGLLSANEAADATNNALLGDVKKIVDDAFAAVPKDKWVLDAPLNVEKPENYEVIVPTLALNLNGSSQQEVVLVSGIHDKDKNQDVTQTILDSLTSTKGDAPTFAGTNIALTLDRAQRQSLADAIQTAIDKLK